MEHLGKERKKSQTAHLDAFWGDFQLTTKLALAELTDAGQPYRDFCVDGDPVLNPRDESPEGFTVSQGTGLYIGTICSYKLIRVSVATKHPQLSKVLHELCPNSPK